MPIKLKTYFIVTIGCQMNKSDSERLAGHLENCGLKPAKTREKASLVVLNTCGVRQSAEDRVYGLVKAIRGENPKAKIAVTGCLVYRDDVRARLKNNVASWIPTGEFSIFNFQFSNNIKYPRLRRSFGGQATSNIKTLKFGNCEYLKIQPKYNSKISAFVPIGNGCDNFCSYCVVPYARGREVWRPAGEIIDEVRGLVAEGYKEITLIAQNVNSYKSKMSDAFMTGSSRRPAASGTPQDDKAVINFAGLLKMVNDIPGDFWIRFATSHPKDMSDELIRTMSECEKVCEHVHLPIQSGDNAVLKRMNRKYGAGDYKKLVKKIRDYIQYSTTDIQPNPKYKIQKSKLALPAAITTDVIVGFPGETKKQFENTMKLFREVGFDQAFIARYSPRPGTAAAKMADNVPHEEKIRRDKILEGIVSRKALKNNKKYVGQTVEILIEGKNRKGEWCGRTRTGKNMTIENAKTGVRIMAGKFIDALITGAHDFGLQGEIPGK